MAQAGSTAAVAGGIGDPDRVARLREAVAGFSAAELAWASGYLAGLADGGAAAAAEGAASPAAGAALTVLYGSQTGNARGVAEQLADAARARGLGVEVVSLADYRPARLAKERFLVVVVSTHGEGEPPDDAIDFHAFLLGRRAPALGDLRYAVLALGDSSYEHFCKTGREVDERLAALGARRLLDRVDCDVDFREEAGSWSERLIDEAARELPAAGGRAAPRLQAVPSRPRHGPDHPYAAEILACQPLTASGSDVDVRHVELDLGDSGLGYQPGDSLAVRPQNGPGIVGPVLEAVGLDGGTEVGGRRLGEILASEFELTVLSRRFLEGWAGLSGDAALPGLLADRAGTAAWMKDRQVIDVLRQHPARPAPEAFLGCLRPLTPRLYSIASGPSANPGELHLTVAVVGYEAWGHAHQGAASSFLAGLEPGARIPVWVEPNERFRLPADDVPVIMIGPGTGVAPFRAFVEERDARGARGRNWLFFGARRFSTDFLYQLEWLRYRKQGLLTRLDVAFSRDQEEKVYVQHRLLEQAAELYDWLEEGAHLYVCGDAARMAPDVHKALVGAVARASGRGAEAASEYVDELRRAGRYLRDVY